LVDAVVAPYPTLDVDGVSVLVLVADVVLDVVLYPSPDVVVVLVVLVVFYPSARASEMP
jgi:hypothetical protein